MKLSHLALALSLALGAATAAAQTAPAAPAAQAPARPAPVAAQAAGNLARFVVGPNGHVRGLALNNGTIVMLPPRAGADLAQRVGVGVPLRVEGFSVPGAPHMIFRATVRGADGSVLVAAPQGPMGPHGGFGAGRGEHPEHGGMRGGMRGGMHRGGPWGGRGGAHEGGMRGGFGAARAARLAAMPQQRLNGTVQQVIAGPRGGVRALLLSNNATVTVPRPMAAPLAQRGVRVGESVQVVGRGTATPQGTGVIAEQLTFADGARFAADLTAPPAAPAAR
ncbi:MAG: hypothetical protein U0324_31600 [Polyangiales bacterium]